MTDWKELKGKRVLIRIGYPPFKTEIIEVEVEEVSPSGKYVKIYHDLTHKWVSADNITLLEVLGK